METSKAWQIYWLYISKLVRDSDEVSKYGFFKSYIFIHIPAKKKY